MTFRTVSAAELLLRSSTKDHWALADAVLADVPDAGKGGRPKTTPREGGGFETVDERLAEVAAELVQRGVLQPDGEPYTASTLSKARDVAMAWPPEFRLEAASYRTHQEAGSAKSDNGKVLATLCRVAEGMNVRRPQSVDERAWPEAVESVTRKRGLSRRYLVSANDLRLAIGRRPNVPGRAASTEDDLAATRRVMADPDLAVEVMEDPETNQAALTAHQKILKRESGRRMAERGVSLPPRSRVGPADRPEEALSSIRVAEVLNEIVGYSDEAVQGAQDTLTDYERIVALLDNEGRLIVDEHAEAAANAWQLVLSRVRGGGVTDSVPADWR